MIILNILFLVINSLECTVIFLKIYIHENQVVLCVSIIA